MVRLSREIAIYLASEFGPRDVLRRLSDPFWFQAFGRVLGFDWHSSGVTTTVCGAVKEGIKTIEMLNRAINRSAIDRSEKAQAFRRLATFGDANRGGGLLTKRGGMSRAPGRHCGGGSAHHGQRSRDGADNRGIPGRDTVHRRAQK